MGRGSAVLGGVYARLAQPAQVRRIRQALIALSLLWAVLGGVQLFWALFPKPDTTLPDTLVILNPAETSTAAGQTESLDIKKLVSWHLLGKADEAAVVTEAVPVEASSMREGIEENARETRLDLRLRGIVASTEDGLGHAIIEYKSKQQVYAVEDKLPVSGRVILAKVMPDRVVIDNRGTYELLILYEETALSARVSKTPPKKASTVAIPKVVDKRNEA